MHRIAALPFVVIVRKKIQNDITALVLSATKIKLLCLFLWRSFADIQKYVKHKVYISKRGQEF